MFKIFEPRTNKNQYYFFFRSPDIDRWVNRGFPGASLINKNEKYFYYHHSAGDSMLVENPDDLDRNTGLFAAAAYVIANLSVDMPRDAIKD